MRKCFIFLGINFNSKNLIKTRTQTVINVVATARLIWPQPQAIPIAATIHNVEAVVSPVTVNPCLKTVPAPIKPIPVIIWAATRDGSPNGYKVTAVENPYIERIVNNTIYAEGNAGSHSWSLVTGMELQDNFGYIAGNKIKVYNKQGYVSGSNAYGISFSQWGMANPVFNITNNCVNLINGDYAVYIQSSNPTTYVTDNCLTSTNYSGDNAVYHTTYVSISGNHGCTCTNCPVHP